MAGYLQSEVDAKGATRVRISNSGVLSIAEFDTDTWSGTDEATLDPTGLRALAALALIVAEELDPRRSIASFEDMP